MDIYIKGYYGYQNLGDEFLLVGLLNWLEKEYTPQKIYIESGDKQWLQSRLQKCKKFVKTDIDSIVYVSKSSSKGRKGTLKVFGGGEVLTDARPFPWNGWNYLLGFFGDITRKNYILCGGIGSAERRGTAFLYTILLGRSRRVILRDTTSWERAKNYLPSAELYHDFCYDLLQLVVLRPVVREPYILLNVNMYIWNDNTKEKMLEQLRKFPNHRIYFLPAAWSGDDVGYQDIQSLIPQAQLLDRREMSVEELVGRIAGSAHVCAARLHILLIAQRAGVSYTPFVYQEKIEKCILSQSERDFRTSF